MNRTLRLAALAILLGITLQTRAWASTWVDPDWPTMIKDAKLIVLVEVVEGGNFEAKVKALKTFKGEAPNGTFTVKGFNDSYLAEDDIEKGAFKKGQKYYLFLDKSGHTPSPTAGNLLLDDGKVKLSLHFTTWSRYRGTERPADEIDQFLKHAAAFQADGTTNKEFLDRLGKELDESLKSKDKDAAPDYFLLALHLVGETRYLDSFNDLPAHESMRVRIGLARLLGQVKDERAPKLLEKLIVDKDTNVQGEAVRQYAKGDPEVVGPVLLKALSQAKEGGKGPGGLMDPVRNVVFGGKLEMVRAFGKLKYKPAAKELLDLLETDDHMLFFVTVDSLIQMENKDYVNAFQKKLEKGDHWIFQGITGLIEKQKIKEAKPILEQYVDKHLEHYLAKGKDDPKGKEDPYQIWLAIRALGTVGDDDSGKVLDRQLKAVLARKSTQKDDVNLMWNLAYAMATLKYAPGKRTAYDTLFFWFGCDDIVIANDKVLAIKDRLEKQFADKAGESLGELKDKKVHCVVYLENRSELAENAKAEPRYHTLIRIDTSDHLAESRLTKLRTIAAKATGLPEECVGIRSEYKRPEPVASGSGFEINEVGVEPRLRNNSDGAVLIEMLCVYLQSGHNKKDIAVLRWLVEHGYREKKEVERWLPGVFDEK